MARISKSQKPTPSQPGERADNSDVRRLRNRMSQKAFRARQAMRIKELEERLQARGGGGRTGGGSENEWVTHLQDRNAALRDQLLQCHKKFTSLQVSMKALADATALALDIEGIDESETGKICARCKANDIQQGKGDSDDREEDPSFLGADNSREKDDLSGDDYGQLNPEPPAPSQDASLSAFTYRADTDPDTFQPAINLNYFSPSGTLEPAPPASSGIEDNNGPRNGIPSPMTWDLRFSPHDLGPNQYSHVLEVSPFISGPESSSSLKLKKTNSTFSDHIDALECLMSRSWSKMQNTTTAMVVGEKITSSIRSMLLTFVSISWQTMTAWHTHTRAHEALKNLTEWRMYKTPETYAQIIPSYRPTRLQMAVSYPSVIAWIPWPSLRDKMILHHAANPRLDELVCDVGNSYVVQADLSRLVRCPEPVIGYVGVWDMVRAIAPEATVSSPRSARENSCPSPCEEDVIGAAPWDASPRFAPGSVATHSPFQGADDQGPDADTIRHILDIETMAHSQSHSHSRSLPCENVDELFSSRSLAMQAFKALGMDTGAFRYRLDPAFFERHPELYDPSSNLMAQGVALRPSRQVAMVGPRHLDSSVVGQYQEMAKYVVDMMLEAKQI